MINETSNTLNSFFKNRENSLNIRREQAFLEKLMVITHDEALGDYQSIEVARKERDCKIEDLIDELNEV